MHQPINAAAMRGIDLVRRKALAGICAGLLGVTASCAPVMDRGEEATQPADMRFVSLNPCTDALLVELADPQQIIALSHYSASPASRSIAPEVASVFATTGGSVEEVIALDPDAVIASSFMPPARRAALGDLGLPVEQFGIASSVDASIAQVRRMAALVGHAERGEVLVARIENAVAALEIATQQAGEVATPSAILWQPGQIVPGEGTLVDELLARAGMRSHSAQQGLGQASYLALEEIIANPPDVLLLAGSERGQSHPVVGQVEGMRVERFDPALLYCGGPTIIRAAERLRAIAGKRS